MEQWKTLDFEEGYSNFMVSDLGRIKNSRTGNILKSDVSNAGYHRVNLYNTITKKQRKFAIHRLVALYFVEGDKSLDVNHLDGDKDDNTAVNLEWCTKGENNAHAFRTGLRSQNGTKNPSNIYSEAQIHGICKLIEKGLSTREITVEIFGEHKDTYKNLVNHIKGKRRWTEISESYNF